MKNAILYVCKCGQVRSFKVWQKLSIDEVVKAAIKLGYEFIILKLDTCLNCKPKGA